MKLNKQDSEDCNAPVWQQLLPTSVPTPTVESSDVRVNIPTEETSNPARESVRKSNGSWLPFPPSWAERQRIRSDGEQPPTDGDPRQKSEKSSSSPLMRFAFYHFQISTYTFLNVGTPIT